MLLIILIDTTNAMNYKSSNKKRFFCSFYIKMCQNCNKRGRSDEKLNNYI